MIRARLIERQHYFFKAQMLTSQFADLEEPANAIVIDVEIAPSIAVRRIVDALFPAGRPLENGRNAGSMPWKR